MKTIVYYNSGKEDISVTTAKLVTAGVPFVAVDVAIEVALANKEQAASTTLDCGDIKAMLRELLLRVRTIT